MERRGVSHGRARHFGRRERLRLSPRNPQQFEPRTSDPSRWFASFAWPLPAVVVHAAILALDPRIWRIMITGSGRSGSPWTVSAGLLHLAILMILMGAYWASCAFPWPSTWTPGRFSGLRQPTPEEQGCAVALLRLMLLAGLYLSAWRLAATALVH